MPEPDQKEKAIVLENPLQLIQMELEEIQKSLKETYLMLEQSRLDVGKLSQRNSLVTADLQRIHSNLQTIPQDEIRNAYETAMDVHQRLFVMRGQMEKLQGDVSRLEHTQVILEQIKNSLDSSVNKESSSRQNSNSMELLVNVQEAERQRLSRQMHDGPAQALSNFILQTEIAMRLFDVEPTQAREELADLKVAAMRTFQKVRNFIFELRPMMLDDLGLPPTIVRYADMFKEQAGVEISVTVTGTERRLEPYVEVMLFRSMQELLSNAVHQNQANVIKIQLDMDEKQVRMLMDDNGKGFDTDALGKEANLGLKLIKERVESLGGVFFISSSPGKGARISLSIPIQGEATVKSLQS